MADVTVVAAEVLPGTVTKYVTGIAGEALTPGQLVYLKAADSKYWKTDNAAAASAVIAGVVMGGGLAANHPVIIAVEGTIDPGFTVTVGEIYVASATAGGISPEADNGSGEYVSIVGAGTSASELTLGIINSGVAVP